MAKVTMQVLQCGAGHEWQREPKRGASPKFCPEHVGTKPQKEAPSEVFNGDISNAGEFTIEMSVPYVAQATLKGVSPILFHRWDSDDVEAKDKAAKGSTAKKTDNLEAYVYRNEGGEIGIPGEYLRMALVNAAKYRKDPRSPRKSMMDMAKAGLISLTDVASLGTEQWDFVDRRRVTIQRNGITRQRPGFNSGWTATFELMVNLPEYIHPDLLHALIADAGRLVGLGDFRPTYGRFIITEFKKV